MPTKYLKMILNSPVYDVAQETLLEANSPKLSDRLKIISLLKGKTFNLFFLSKSEGPITKLLN